MLGHPPETYQNTYADSTGRTVVKSVDEIFQSLNSIYNFNL